jgi:hypothetical protein
MGTPLIANRLLLAAGSDGSLVTDGIHGDLGQATLCIIGDMYDKYQFSLPFISITSKLDPIIGV